MLNNPAQASRKRLYTISEAAKILGVSVKTLRRWEKRGLYESRRTAGGKRRYVLSDIRNLQALNLSGTKGLKPQYPKYESLNTVVLVKSFLPTVLRDLRSLTVHILASLKLVLTKVFHLYAKRGIYLAYSGLRLAHAKAQAGAISLGAQIGYHHNKLQHSIALRHELGHFLRLGVALVVAVFILSSVGIVASEVVPGFPKLEPPKLALKIPFFGPTSDESKPTSDVSEDDSTFKVDLDSLKVKLSDLETVIADFSLHGHAFEKITLTSDYFSSLDGSKLSSLNADKLDEFDSGDFLTSNKVDTAEAAITFRATPGSSAVSGGPLYINPGSATAGYTLFGVALNGSSRFKVDAEGDVTLSGDLTVSGGDITLGTTSIFSGGDTASLNNIDAIDATTETTFEDAIDALANLVTVGTITTGTWSATDIALSAGGTGASLTDPNADRLFFWDDSAGSTDFLSVGSGLSLSGTELTATGTSPWQTTSNVANLVTSGDTVTVGSSTALAKLAVDGDADEVQLLVQGNATQTSNLVVFEQSDGTDSFTLTNAGALTALGNINSSGGALQTNSVTRIDNAGVGTFASGTTVNSVAVAPADANYATFGTNATLTAETDLSSGTFWFQNEIKGWPPYVADGTSLVGLWWEKLTGSETTLAVEDIAGEAGVTETYERAIKCVTAAADQGCYQRLIYADEPRLKSGRVISGIAAIWVASGGAVELRLTTQNAVSQVVSAEASAAAWTVVTAENLTLDGAHVDMRFVQKTTAGTFYVVPLGMSIGSKAVALPPRGYRVVNKEANSWVVQNVDPGGGGFTDFDMTTATSPLAFAAGFHTYYSNDTSTSHIIYIRRNGDTSSTDIQARAVMNASTTIDAFAQYFQFLDDGQIAEYDSDAPSGDTEGVWIGVTEWWEWE